MTPKEKVLTTYQAHPDWTCKQIGEAIGKHPAYVRNALKSAKITPTRERAEKSQIEDRNVMIPRAAFRAMEDEADRRGTSARLLIRELISVIANEKLVGALLDD